MRLLTFALLLAALGCGGGGGATPLAAPAPGPGPGPTVSPGSLNGSIEVLVPEAETVLESEPNDAVDQAHFIGELRAGTTVSIVGHTGAADGRDGFRLLMPERVRVVVTLEYSGSPLTVGVWDFNGLQFVEKFAGAASPVSGEFHAKGVIDLVVEAASGEGDFVLTLTANVPSAQIPEREPNGVPYTGQFLGEVIEGDQVVTSAEGRFPLDKRDGVTIACPAAIKLDLLLFIPATGIPQAATFDLEVFDLTGGDDPPPSLGTATWNGTTATLQVDIAAGSLIHIDAVCTSSTAKYAMIIKGLASAQGGASQMVAAADAYGTLALDFVPGEALIAGAGHGCKCVDTMPCGTACVDLDLPAGLDEAAAKRWTLRRIRCLQRCATVTSAEPNYIRRAFLEPDDEHFNLQWHYSLIRLPQAWEITTGSNNVIVAVIDTGETQHPDLAGRQMAGYDFISSSSRARDGDGRDGDPTDEGDEAMPGGASTFHGSHVAGTVGAATDNSEGVAGVTWQTRIMHLRVLGVNGGTDFDVANAILYAAGLQNASGLLPTEKAHIINMSLGGPGSSSVLRDAVERAKAAGVVIFAASGNSNTTSPSYPAAYPEVVSVGAVDFNGDRAPYSNYGSTLDIVAPGGRTGRDDNGDGWPDGVLSTRYDDSVNPPDAIYTFFQGTSMASPHAAGVAALMLAVDPTLTPDEIQAVLESTAEDRGSVGVDSEYGHGLIDAHAAVLAVVPAPPPPPPPELSISAEALNFLPGQSVKTVLITNTGGLPLTVDTPTTVQQGNWLSATLQPSSSSTTNASAVFVRIDRSGLTDGVYFGRVLLTSDGGSATIQVLMRVESTPPGPKDIDVWVRVIDVDTGLVAAQVIVNPSTTLNFDLKDIPPGTYRLEAGSDVDNDGILCEPGELCGTYPLLEQPILIELKSGETRGPFKFTVAPPASLATGG